MYGAVVDVAKTVVDGAKEGAESLSGDGHSYEPGWYRAVETASARSAAVVVPMIVELLGPRSVVDVGCGTGSWLAAFAAAGLTDLTGIDGPDIPSTMLRIPKECFARIDLSRDDPSLGRTFDLALSLEVAEHLPPGRAAGFVRALTELAPAVVFSAAIPDQGGTVHVNEKWADYWERLFTEHGYRQADVFRAVLWDNPDVQYWYAQNMYLYLDRQHPYWSRHPDGSEAARSFPSRVVHPGLLAVYREENAALTEQLRGAGRSSLRAAGSRLLTRSARAVERAVTRKGGKA